MQMVDMHMGGAHAGGGAFPGGGLGRNPNQIRFGGFCDIHLNSSCRKDDGNAHEQMMDMQMGGGAFPGGGMGGMMGGGVR